MHLADIWCSLSITLQSIYGSSLLTQEAFTECLLRASTAGGGGEGSGQTFVEALAVDKEPRQPFYHVIVTKATCTLSFNRKLKFKLLPGYILIRKAKE